MVRRVWALVKDSFCVIGWYNTQRCVLEIRLEVIVGWYDDSSVLETSFDVEGPTEEKGQRLQNRSHSLGAYVEEKQAAVFQRCFQGFVI